MTRQEKCKGCKFYTNIEQVVFLFRHFGPSEEHTFKEQACSRYPAHVKVSENHWCGEYVSREEAP
jgi:hypothetical protein